MARKSSARPGGWKPHLAWPWTFPGLRQYAAFLIEKEIQCKTISSVSMSRSFWQKCVSVSIIASPNQAPASTGESLSFSTDCSGAPSEMEPSVLRFPLCTQLSIPGKLSYQMKCYWWASMSSLWAVTGNQTQGNSCLYAHIIDWLQWFHTLAFFSLQCIPYHYPPRGHFTLGSPASFLLLFCIKLYGK